MTEIYWQNAYEDEEISICFIKLVENASLSCNLFKF